jgi:hypothetical protein
MTTLPETAPQPRKSSADFANWRETVPRMDQATIDFWDMLRKRSQAAIGISGEMPFTFVPNRVPPMDPRGLVDPAKGAPTGFDVQQFIRPGSNFPIQNPASAAFPTFTPQMQTDLLTALQGLVGKPGFEQLGPLLGLLGKG